MKVVIFLDQSVINLRVDFFEFSKDGLWRRGVNENRFLDDSREIDKWNIVFEIGKNHHDLFEIAL